MEDFCKQAENKIVEMKSQLDEMKEVQNHPIKTALQNTIKALEARVSEIREQIAELRVNIIDGCKNAVAVFKDKGIGALDKLASFFQIKSGLQQIKNNTLAATNDCDKALIKIEAFSKEYNKAGRAFKNIARIVVGKEPIDAVKESGKVAKVISAPYRAKIACMGGIRRAANSAIEKIDKLSLTAESKREEKAPAKKPSLNERLKEKKELVRQKDLERTVPERTPVSRGLSV